MAHPTDLRLVFEAFGGRQREFDWLLTDLELNRYPPGLAYRPESRSSDARWLSGTELSEIVNTQDIQFIWGVLSGFPPGIAVDAVKRDTYPYADGNRALWAPNVSIQHPLAEVEIVCWDSSATLLLSRDDDLTGRFRRFFPEAVDLNEHNYWEHLEHRVCREFEGMEDRTLRFFSCDGFIPQEYLVNDRSPRITGLAWIGSAPRQEQWAFEVVLPNAVLSLEHVPWHTLLPAEDATGWLSIDVERRQIRIGS